MFKRIIAMTICIVMLSTLQAVPIVFADPTSSYHNDANNSGWAQWDGFTTGWTLSEIFGNYYFAETGTWNRNGNNFLCSRMQYGSFTLKSPHEDTVISAIQLQYAQATSQQVWITLDWLDEQGTVIDTKTTEVTRISTYTPSGDFNKGVDHFAPEGGAAMVRVTIKKTRDYEEYDKVFFNYLKLSYEMDPRTGDNVVRSVAVSPKETEAGLGRTTQFTANVKVYGSATTAVKWEVSGNNSPLTTVSTVGELFVAANETATTLHVRATSLEPGFEQMYDEATVTVVHPAVKSVVMSPKDFVMTYGTTSLIDAKVETVGGEDDYVIFSISGAFTSAASSFKQTGSKSAELVLGKDETATKVTITATSRADSTKFDTGTVTLTNRNPEDYKGSVVFENFGNKTIQNIFGEYLDGTPTPWFINSGNMSPNTSSYFTLKTIIPETVISSIQLAAYVPTNTGLIKMEFFDEYGNTVLQDEKNIGESYQNKWYSETGPTQGIVYVPFANDERGIRGAKTVKITLTQPKSEIRLTKVVLNYEQSPAVDLEPKVKCIEIDKPYTSAKLGEQLQFAASTYVVGNAPRSVEWSISNNNSANTKILSDIGLLTIGADETAEVLNIKAVSTFDNSVFAEAQVRIVPKDYTALSFGTKFRIYSNPNYVGNGQFGNSALWAVKPDAGLINATENSLYINTSGFSAGDGIIHTVKEENHDGANTRVTVHHKVGLSTYWPGRYGGMYMNQDSDLAAVITYKDADGNIVKSPAYRFTGFHYNAKQAAYFPLGVKVAYRGSDKLIYSGDSQHPEYVDVIKANAVLKPDGTIIATGDGLVTKHNTSVVEVKTGDVVKPDGTIIRNGEVFSTVTQDIDLGNGRILKPNGEVHVGNLWIYPNGDVFDAGHNRISSYGGYTILPGDELEYDLGTYPNIIDVNIYHILDSASDPSNQGLDSNYGPSSPPHMWVSFEITGLAGEVSKPEQSYNNVTGKYEDMYVETKVLPSRDVGLKTEVYPGTQDPPASLAWKPIKLYSPLQIDNTNAPVVSLGYGANFYLFGANGDASPVAQVGVNPDTSKWSLFTTNSATISNSNNGRTEVRVPVGKSINNGSNNRGRGDQGSGVWWHVFSVNGPGVEAEYIPREGLLDNVWTEVRAYHFIRGSSGSSLNFKAIVKYVDLDGTLKEETVKYYRYPEETVTDNIFYFLPIKDSESAYPNGAYPNLKSVTIINTGSGTDQFFPNLEFVVSGENINEVPPPFPRKIYQKPGIATKQPEVLDTQAPKSPSTANGALYINEVLTNSQIDMDDFIEMYNASGSDIPLGGYTLSDSPTKEPNKWTFPQGTEIKAGGHLVVWAAGSDTPEADGKLHANFSISSGGEDIGLFDPAGNELDRFAIPALKPDVSISRVPDGSDKFLNTKPSPGKSNDDAVVLENIDKPRFTHESGFYKDPFKLELFAKGDIYYTLDGSKPSLKNLTGGQPDSYLIKTDKTYKYDPSSGIWVDNYNSNSNVISSIKYATGGNPLSTNEPLDKTMVVRAASIDNDGNLSEVVSKTFFVGYDMDKNFGNIMVMSFATDKENLFDPNSGAFTNYMWQGREFEKEVHVDVFDRNGTLAVNQSVGMRVRGYGYKGAPQKQFNIYARAEYGKSKIDYPLFENSVSFVDGSLVTSYKSVALRNGSLGYSGFRYQDGLSQYMAGENGAAFQCQRPVVAFINGEYWGVYYMSERVSADYVESHYGIPAKDVIVMKNGGVDNGYAEDSALSEYKIGGNYSDVTRYHDTLDMMNHTIGNAIANNGDYYGYNFATWRSRYSDGRSGSPYENGQWRYLMYDLDNSWGSDNCGAGISSNNNAVIIRPQGEALRRDPGLKKVFLNYMLDVFNNENSVYRQFEEFVYWEAEYAMHSAKMFGPNSRWKDERNTGEAKGTPSSLLNTAYYMPTALKDRFGTTGDYTHLNVTTNDFKGGKVKVNYFTEHDFSCGHSYTTRNFTGYTSVLEAIPNPGYKFARWEASDGTGLTQDTDNENMVYVTLSPNGSRVTAVFEPLSSGMITYFEYKDGEANTANPAYNATNGDKSATLSFYNGMQPVNIGASGKTPVNAKAEWTSNGSAGGSSAWEIKLSTKGYKDIYFNASQKSTPAGPADWKLAYKDSNGAFVDIENSARRITGASDDTYGALSPSYEYFKLPSVLDDKEEVTLRVYMATMLNASDVPVTANNGNTSINNIGIYGTQTGTGTNLSFNENMISVSGAGDLTSAVAIVTSYNNGMLNDVALVNIPLTNGTGTASLPEGFEAGPDGKIKILLVNNMVKISPLCEAIEATI